MPEPTKDKKDKKDDDTPQTFEMTQEKIDELINKAYARGAANSKEGREVKEKLDRLEALETEYAEAQEQLKELQEQLKGKKGGSGDDKKATAEAAELLERMESMKREYTGQINTLKSELESTRSKGAEREQEFRNTQLRADVIAAATKAGAHQPEDVYYLMNSRKLLRRENDDGDVQVYDGSGKLILDIDEGGEPISLAKGVARYVDENPHLKKSTGRTGSDQGGAGNTGGQITVGDQQVPVNQLTPSQTYQNKDAIVRGLRDGTITAAKK